MVEFAETVRLWLESLIHQLGYVGIALITVLETIVPPLPSDMVVPVAGLLVAQGKMTVVGIVVSATIGSLIGASILYGVARWAGAPLARRLVRDYGRWILLSEDDFDKVERLFNRYGTSIILFGHLIPGVRSLISIPAGMTKMPFALFLLLTTIGAAIRVTFQAATGALLGYYWQPMIAIVEEFEWVLYTVLVVVGVIVLIRLGREVRNRLTPPPAAG
jgi:membrane protein DedA with SNARE-associated domain